jgi:cell fate regulator YaaT (PSP1 superfamily)
VTAAAVATHLVEIEFKGNRRVFYQWSGEAPPPLKTAVIVTVDRGEDLGRVHSTGELADKRKAGTTHGKASPNELPMIVRVATPQEVDRAVRLRADEHAVRKAAIELARELKLDLKISDTEWQWDRRKLTCFFTAEERVDFRELVRRLERRFSTRVHMWHIGVRDEARRLDGIGRCGRQFCSASWLPELRPVKSSTAKDQRLSTLNPAQISGTCGRLMCCLRHEHEFYVQARKRFPKEGKIITTAAGEEKVVSNDIFRDQVTLRNPEGEFRTIPLAQLRKETAPGVVPAEAEVLNGELVAIKRVSADDEEADIEADTPDEVGDAGSAVGAVEELEASEPDAAEDLRDDEPTGDTSTTGSNASGSTGTQSSASGDSSAADDLERRRRRRRGRRGGRRNRGPDAPPSSDS